LDEPRPYDEPVGESVAPSLIGRIYYSLGGTLGERELEWVRQDNTADGWRRRHVVRMTSLFAIFALLSALVPGRADVRTSLLVMFLLSGVVMGASTASRWRNRRLENHGFVAVPPPVNREDAILDAMEAEGYEPGLGPEDFEAGEDQP
jgi:hypothetical protein